MLIDLTAKTVLDDFKVAFRVEPPDWNWLRRMRQDLEAVEREAIGVWERFLERVPLALRTPGVEMGIAEFQVLCKGAGWGSGPTLVRGGVARGSVVPVAARGGQARLRTGGAQSCQREKSRGRDPCAALRGGYGGALARGRSSPRADFRG